MSSGTFRDFAWPLKAVGKHTQSLPYLSHLEVISRSEKRILAANICKTSIMLQLSKPLTRRTKQCRLTFKLHK